jgi:hypothetical protein
MPREIRGSGEVWRRSSGNVVCRSCLEVSTGVGLRDAGGPRGGGGAGEHNPHLSSGRNSPAAFLESWRGVYAGGSPSGTQSDDPQAARSQKRNDSYPIYSYPIWCHHEGRASTPVAARSRFLGRAWQTVRSDSPEPSGFLKFLG